MAAIFYPSGRSAFGKGEVNWQSGQSGIRAVLVNVPSYTYSDSHTSLSDIASLSRRATVTPTLLDPAQGSVRVNQVAFNGLSGLSAAQAVIFYVHNVTESSATLLAYFDVAVPSNSNSLQLTYTNNNKVIGLGGNV